MNPVLAEILSSKAVRSADGTTRPAHAAILQDTGVMLGRLIRQHKPKVSIEKTFFSQPGAAVGPCLNFNLVTTKDGPLVMTATWQHGILDLGNVEQEADFVRNVCSRIENDIGELSMASV